VPWRTADPAAAGFDAAALRRIAADARRRGSTCLVVARDGALVGEWNWQGVARDEPREVFSVTKSVTSTLVGIAQADGDLAIDDRAAAYVADWRGTDAGVVTVRNLLANDSGRFWSRASDYVGLLRATDRTAYAVGLPQQSPPGEVWAYNNAAIQTLDRVLATATGEAPADLARDRLFRPLGMADTLMTRDASGRSTNLSFGMRSTCRDLARFGRLFAQRGTWQGDEVVPASWVAEAVGAPSQRRNAAYGLLWWLNRRGPLRGPLNTVDETAPPDVRAVGRLAPGAPADLFAALGFGGQVVLVDPGSETVVVRLGDPPEPGARAYGFADAARVVTEALRP
jgi:CubicO group peptidase (beta-lactamase class C family)